MILQRILSGGQHMKSVFVNGVTLHYEEMGAGRPVVLVHGNGEDHHIFDMEIAQLVKAGYHVYAPDSRGHGGYVSVYPCDEA